MDELEALLILSSFKYLGSVKIRLLMKHYGSAADALKAPLSELALFPGFGPKVLDAWKNGIQQEQWRDNLRLAEQYQTQIISFLDSKYPSSLLELTDFPLILYIQGHIPTKNELKLAIVGTRQSSIYGQEMAKQLSKELAQAGITIISGLARGIDTAAHQGALEGGKTLAILGSGLACLYPSENRGLANAIIQKGAVISEFPMRASPERQNFPQRNRIVSAMSMGILLIEAPLHSGGMLTVKKGLEQKKPIFTIPGRADLENFRGNHALIKENQAKLIENTQDIIRHYSDCSLSFNLNPGSAPAIFLEQEEEEFLQKLPAQELSIEELMVKTSLPIAKLNVILMSLVLKKMIKEYPGKVYKKR